MTKTKMPILKAKQPSVPATKQDTPKDQGSEPSPKWYASIVSQAAVMANRPAPAAPPPRVLAPRVETTDKGAVTRLEQLVNQLEAKDAARDSGLLSEISAAIGSIFDVKQDEVALLTLAPDAMSLGFVLPVALQRAGAIPADSKVAVAARSVRERRPEIINNFAMQSHARVFEIISPEHSSAEPIQKIMSAPVFHGDNLAGVAQISRKAATAASAGPDFVGKDLKQLQEINALLARIIAAHIPEIPKTCPDAPAITLQPSSVMKHRRAPRVSIAIPIEVIYQGSENKLVAEDAKTFIVSAYGAGILLKQAPPVEQAIVLIHKLTREEVFCRVADVRQLPRSSDYDVGVAFTEAKPYFWRISFPHPDSNPTERKQFGGAK